MSLSPRTHFSPTETDTRGMAGLEVDGKVIRSSSPESTFEYWNKKLNSFDELIPTLAITDEKKESMRSTLKSAHEYLNQLRQTSVLNPLSTDRLSEFRAELCQMMRDGSQDQTAEDLAAGRRNEMIAGAGIMVSSIAIGVCITYLTMGTGTAVMGALMAKGISLGTATVWGTTVASVAGAGIGATTHATRSAAEDLWMGNEVDISKMKHEAILGAVDGAIAAFAPVLGRGIAKSVFGQEALTQARRIGVGVSQQVIDGYLSGFATETTRGLMSKENKSWSEILAQGALGGLIGAGFSVLLPLGIKGLALGAKSLVTRIAPSKAHWFEPRPAVLKPSEPTTLEEAKDSMARYKPTPDEVRHIPGGITAVPPEGVRTVAKAVLDDPKFVDLHGGADKLQERLAPHRVLGVLDYFGIKLTKKSAHLNSLDANDPKYKEQMAASLKEKLDDDTIKKTLQFFGVNADTDAAWQQQIRWAREGWENPKSIITDVDDTIIDNWNPHATEVLSLQFPVKAILALAHTFSGGRINIAGMNFSVQARPQAYEIMKVLRQGDTIPVQTDGYKRMLYNLYQLFPTHRFTHTFKLPYQQTRFLEDVDQNRWIYTLREHQTALENLHDKLKEQGWKSVPSLQSTIAMTVFGAGKPKQKMETLADMIYRTDPAEGSAKRILIDNAERHAEHGYARLGSPAIHIQDRKQTALGGNFGFGDPFSLADMAARHYGYKRLSRWLSSVGRLNQLPQSRYGVWDYVLPLFKREKPLPPLVSFNKPVSSGSTWGSIMENVVYRPMPKNGLVPGSQVQRGVVYVPWAAKGDGYNSVKRDCQRITAKIRGVLHSQTDENGESAFDQALGLYTSIKNHPLEKEIYPDIPASPTGS